MGLTPHISLHDMQYSSAIPCNRLAGCFGARYCTLHPTSLYASAHCIVTEPAAPACFQRPFSACLQEYTFTLTLDDGQRLQGFCRRFLPPVGRTGVKLRYPQVLCLICPASWHPFFFKVRLSDDSSETGASHKLHALAFLQTSPVSSKPHNRVQLRARLLPGKFARCFPPAVAASAAR